MKVVFLWLSILTKILIITNVFSLQTFKKPIDLTWPFENNTIYWPGVQPFIFTKMLRLTSSDKKWVALNEFCSGEHVGTHLDAPYHFNKNGIKVGEIPIENLIVPGALIDMSKEVMKNGPNTTLKVEHLLKWEKDHGKFDYNTLLLINFGYSQYYPDRSLYLGPDHVNGNLCFPGISPEAAQWLADTKKIVGVGVDTASVDPGISTTADAHKILNANGIYLIESAKLLENLPSRNFTLIALPMKIREGTGAPLRLVAVPKSLHQEF